jgi:hypothetical protein
MMCMTGWMGLCYDYFSILKSFRTFLSLLEIGRKDELIDRLTKFTTKNSTESLLVAAALSNDENSENLDPIFSTDLKQKVSHPNNKRVLKIPDCSLVEQVRLSEEEA